MSLYAVVSPAGAVLNLVNWDGKTAYDVTPNTLVAASGQPNAQIGGTYAGGVFTPPAPVVSVPASVTAPQLREGLTALGMRAALEAVVAKQSQAVQDYYAFSTVFSRDNPQLAAIAAAGGFTDAQVDAVFVAAAGFPASA